jgi:hypothetical protein
MSETCWGEKTSSVGNKLSFPTPTQHIFSITAAMVMSVSAQLMCGVGGLLKIFLANSLEVLPWDRTAKITSFNLDY